MSIWPDAVFRHFRPDRKADNQMADNALSFASLSRDIRRGALQPVYLIHGEEGFYLDRLVEEFVALVPEADRDFDLTVIYAPEAESAADIEEACRRYPLYGERQVVIVKELQNCAANIRNGLAHYVENPSPTTVLCLCFRAKLSGSAELTKALKKGGGVNFEAVKLKPAGVSAAVEGFIKSEGLTVDPKALSMLCDFVGTDLSRLYNEVGKLTTTLGKGAKVTPEAVERNIGVSKDYNTFELRSALARKEEAKVLTMLRYFAGNPKANPVQPIAAMVFNLFAGVLAAIYAPDKSQDGLMKELGFSRPWQLADYTAAMQRYNAWEVIEILGLLRRFDCASKGVGSRQDPHALLFDLMVHILHPLGQRGVKL